MTIFTINEKNEMIEAPRVELQQEQQLEDWLENSPWAIANEGLLVIGRQTRANFTEKNRFPDLIALDVEGNIVVIELKKGRAPRDVVAQILEYAAWAASLSEEQIINLAENYLNENFHTAFKDYFDLDELPNFGGGLRLFVAAEEIPNSVAEVCRFLRQSLGLNISCVSYKAYRDAENNTLVDSSIIVGVENIAEKSSIKGTSQIANSSSGWNGDIKVKDIIWQAVSDLNTGKENFVFTPKEVISKIQASYPNAKKNTIRCQISADTVNNEKRGHWSGNQDRYWLVEKGVYRLYNRATDISGK